MFGIELTHREELRKKQGIRLFLEETLVDLGHVAAYSGNTLCDAIDFSIRLSKHAKQFAVANKRYAATALFALLAISIMMM